jgi:hypothetical protein
VSALADTCREAGFTLAPRLPVYAEYVAQPGFLDPAMRTLVERHAASKGVPLC